MPRYRSSNMPKLDILEAMAGRKESGCEIDLWRHSGNTKTTVLSSCSSGNFDPMGWKKKKTSNKTMISLDSVEKYIWALYANRNVWCIFCRCSERFETTQNMCYFDTELVWRINMEISKHLWSSWGLHGMNRKSCNRSTSGLCRQQADIQMRLHVLFRFVSDKSATGCLQSCWKLSW